MTTEIVVTVVGIDAVRRTLTALPTGKLKAGVARELDSLGKLLLRKVKQEKLSGQVLHPRTGNLRSNVNVSPASGASDDGQGHLSVSVGTNIWYGRMWELFGHKEIRPIRAKLLAWQSPRGVWHRAKVVRAQAPRPFLKPALNEMKPLVMQRLQATLNALGRQ